jgi:hypothetical protein
MFWGAAKKYAREHCQYSLKALKKIVPEALDSVSVEQLRAYARLSFRWMDAYRHGLSGKPAEYAVKKHRAHRTINENVMALIDA